MEIEKIIPEKNNNGDILEIKCLVKIKYFDVESFLDEYGEWPSESLIGFAGINTKPYPTFKGNMVASETDYDDYIKEETLILIEQSKLFNQYNLDLNKLYFVELKKSKGDPLSRSVEVRFGYEG